MQLLTADSVNKRELEITKTEKVAGRRETAKTIEVRTAADHMADQ